MFLFILEKNFRCLCFKNMWISQQVRQNGYTRGVRGQTLWQKVGSEGQHLYCWCSNDEWIKNNGRICSRI